MRAVGVQRVARRAARRALVSSALALAGQGLAWGAGSAMVVTTGLRLMGEPGAMAEVVRWPLVLAAGAGIGVAVGVSLALWRRWSVARGALELDTRLGLRDRLSSALALADGPESPVAELAVRAGESLAGTIDVRRAIPIGMGRGWLAGLPLLALGVGVGLWLPPLLTRAGSGAGPATLTPEAAREATAEVSELKADAVAAAEELVDDPSIARELESLRDVERELASGRSRDASTPVRAAQAAEQIASSLEAASREQARAADEARASLAKAASRGARAERVGPETEEPSLREHLESGDVEAAAEALEELSRTSPNLSPEERERWASELAELARSLRESQGDANEAAGSPPPVGDAKSADTGPEDAVSGAPPEPRPPRDGSPGTQDTVQSAPPPPPPARPASASPQSESSEQRDAAASDELAPSDAPAGGASERRQREPRPDAGSRPETREAAPGQPGEQERSQPEPPARDEELARSLERAAEQLRGEPSTDRQQRTAEQSATPPGSPPQGQGAPRTGAQEQRERRRSTPEQEGNRRPAPDANPSGARREGEQRPSPTGPSGAERKDSAGQPPQPPSGTSQQVKPSDRGEAPSQQPQPSSEATPGERPSDAADAATRPEPSSSGEGEQRPAQQSPTPPTPQPAPGQGPLPAGQPSANPTQQGNEPRQQQGTQPPSQPTGAQEAPAAQPSENSGARRGDTGTGQTTTRPGAPQDAASPRSGEGDQGQDSPAPGGPPRQPAPGERPQGSPSGGQRSPESSGARGTSEAPSTPTRGMPEAGAQPGAKQPQGSPGGALPELPQSEDAIKDLAKRLADVAEQSRKSQRQAADAQKLRERAERLMKNASPQEREQLERLAREFQREMETRGGSGGEAPPPGEGTPLAQDPRAGRGPMSAPRRPTGPSATQTVDARSTEAGQDRRGERGQRVIAEWLGEGSRGRGQSEAFDGAVREAADGVERAIEQQSVPPGYQDLVRRVFQRYTEAARSGAAAPNGTGTSSAPSGPAPAQTPRP